MSLSIVTFATIGKNYRYRDYSKVLNNLQIKLSHLGFDLLIYSQRDIIPLNFPPIRPFQKLRRGAGYWVWKPFIIKTASAQNKSRYLLYMDVDLLVEGLNQEELIGSLNGNAVAAFEMKDKISDWSSDRCLKVFGKIEIANSLSFASGLLLFDTEHPDFTYWLTTWENYLLEPKLVLDQLFTFKQNHRHDQTILSSLIATGKISVSKLPSTCLILDSSDAAVPCSHGNRSALYHGRMEQSETKIRPRVFLTFIFHKTQLLTFWTEYPFFKFVRRK